MNLTIIVALAGPSGAGKTGLAGGLLRAYPDHCAKWHQVTTRPRRGPGDDYVFLTPPRYALLEEALTCRTQFGGHLYGTFPETGTEGRAVLTIVDRDGLRALAADVEAHNAALALGGEGKFGAGPVALVRVLLTYDVTEESVAARGRAGRGREFVAEELDGLRVLGAFDAEYDTTGGRWPDPAEVFGRLIWPAFAHHAAEAERGAVVEQLRERLRTAGPDEAGLLRAALRTLTGEATDELDSVLGGQAPPAEAPPEPPAGPVVAAEASPATPEPTAAPPAQAAPPAPEPPAAAFASLSALATSTGFEEWVLATGLGAKAFESEASFRGAVSQYMVEHRVPGAAEVVVSSQATTDARGGRVVGYAAATPAGERLTVEYSERLRRVVNMNLH